MKRLGVTDRLARLETKIQNDCIMCLVCARRDMTRAQFFNRRALANMRRVGSITVKYRLRVAGQSVAFAIAAVLTLFLFGVIP